MLWSRGGATISPGVAASSSLVTVQVALPPPPIQTDDKRQVGLFEQVAAVHAAHSLDEQLGEMMGDAPVCDNCGHITVRNGACYKCLNCGSSMGCS